jgi:ABC-type lipoprotein export system ATPase subunit
MQIAGKETILLLGDSGSGKSTTVHYLSGSEMKLTKTAYLNHISVGRVKNTDLLKVKSSPFS